MAGLLQDDKLPRIRPSRLSTARSMTGDETVFERQS